MEEDLQQVARTIGGSMQTIINNIVLEVIHLGDEPPFFSLGIYKWTIHNFEYNVNKSCGCLLQSF